MIGARGFPRIQGGVERHCEELYPRLAKKGYDITVFRRRPYVAPEASEREWRGVKFIDGRCPKIKGIEALYHSMVAGLIAVLKRPSLVHIHNIGPGLIIPLLRSTGLKVVVTYHSPNYEHDKWGPIGKMALKLGEAMTLGLSNQVIFVSRLVKEKFSSKREFRHIPNGVSMPSADVSAQPLNQWGLEKGRFLLAVGRLTPEKGFDLLIEAFKQLETDWKLVIVGSADHETDYSRAIEAAAKTDERIVLTGFLSGDALESVYRYAGCLVLPSRNEGMPLVLLEAFSHGIPTVTSDIPACIELTEDKPFAKRFTSGDSAALRDALREALADEAFLRSGPTAKTFVEQGYNWDKTAEETAAIYEEVLG